MEVPMKIVIVGAGPAGVSAAETVRSHDPQADLVMFSAEPYPPYSPPAMVEYFLHGSAVHLWRGEDWPERIRVDYRAGVNVKRVQPAQHTLLLSDDTRVEYDRLVLATGSRLYAPLEGVDLPGVYNFKSLTAAEALVKRVKTGEAKTAVIVGAGFIGMEIALLLRALGVAVIQLEMLDQVMPAQLDRETAAFAQEVMRQRGIDLRLSTKARAFIGEKQAEGVELETGEFLRGDLFVAATGVRPNLELLQDSGIAHRWGITVDDCLRTSAPDVFAAGDVVEAPDRLTGEAFVHAIFPNAVEQGQVAGLNLLGFDVRYDGADRMNSLKHLGLSIMAVGLKEGDEVLRTRWDGGLRTLYLQEDRLVGFQLVGDIRAAGNLRALLITGRNLRKLKDRLLERTFGQGTVVWDGLAIGGTTPA
jgi:NAD(P)H-nitrite reductase large subunit